MYAPDLTQQLPGPSWLQEARQAAALAAEAAPQPTFEAEEWRYSPIDDLDASAYTPVVEAPPGLGAAMSTYSVDGAGTSVVTVDGFLQSLDVVADANADSDALEVFAASASAAAVVLPTGPDKFSLANAAFAPDPVVIRVKANADIAQTVVVTHHITTSGGASFPKLIVDVGDNASVSVVEVFLSDDISALTIPSTNITVGNAARVKYQQVQNLGGHVWQLGTFTIDIGSQATFAGGIAALGGGYARVRTDCRLNGRGASGDIFAVYYGDDDQTLDFRTFQDHVGRDTRSNLLFKGVLDDASTSIYTGLITVRPDAAGTNAFQTNRTIKLSDKTWAESVPNLEIENNDVRCSHASTVSPVDAEQLFYLESRGVPTEAAERLIVDGFLHEVVAKLPVAGANAALAKLVEAKLERRAS